MVADGKPAYLSPEVAFGRRDRPDRRFTEQRQKVGSAEHAPSTVLLLPPKKALVLRNVAETEYLRPWYVLEVLTKVTPPVRTTAVPICEAVLFGELPGRYSPAGTAEDVRVGGESCHRAADEGRCLGRRKVRILLNSVSPCLLRNSQVVKHLFRTQETGGQSQRCDLMLA